MVCCCSHLRRSCTHHVTWHYWLHGIGKCGAREGGCSRIPVMLSLVRICQLIPHCCQQTRWWSFLGMRWMRMRRMFDDWRVSTLHHESIRCHSLYATRNAWRFWVVVVVWRFGAAASSSLLEGSKQTVVLHRARHTHRQTPPPHPQASVISCCVVCTRAAWTWR
jgi:hypothetical protein